MLTEKYEKVSNYIKSSWIKSVKKKDCDKNFPLPFDYIPPCVDGDLINLYYWDTYFTNKGLYLDGLSEYALGNIKNLIFCLYKFGCVPNMCRANGASYASQPPLLFLMIKDYYEFSHDLEFLKYGYSALNKEYEFWMTKRITPNGLNRHGTNKAFELMTKKQLVDAIGYYAQRVNLDVSNFTKEQLVNKLINVISEGESGQDHTPRFMGKASEVCPIDLNCILYGFEKTMSEFAEILGEDSLAWELKAQKRKDLITEFCLDIESGVFFDYNYNQKMLIKVYSVACYLPFVFNISTDKSAIDKINARLIKDNGVLSCEKVDAKEIYQWGYPNAWAPHQYFSFRANINVGNELVAKEIAMRWLKVVSNEFIKSGKLYEKYDAEIGGKATVDEYGTPEMLGWTAGVFQYFYNEYKD